MDLRSIELRLLANELGLAVDEAAKLPRRHPLRFGLLYGAGPRTLLRYAEATDPAGQEIMSGGISRMPNYADRMTARQMIYVVTFLQSHYVVLRQTMPEYGYY